MPGAGASGGGSGGGEFGTDAVNAIMKHMGDHNGSNPTAFGSLLAIRKVSFVLLFSLLPRPSPIPLPTLLS